MKGSQLNPRKVFMTVVSCVLVMAMGIGITGCTDEKQAVEDTVTTELDMLKNPDQDAIDEWLDSDEATKEELDTYGIDALEFMQHTFGRFDYEIDDVTVDGDTATVDLTVSNADVTTAMENASEQLMASVYTDEEVYDMAINNDQKGLMQKLFSLYYDEVDSVDMIEDQDVTLELEKNDDGDWEITDDSASDLMVALVGDIASETSTDTSSSDGSTSGTSA